MDVVSVIRDFSCCTVVTESSLLLHDLLLDHHDLVELECIIAEKYPAFRLPKNPVNVSDIVEQVKLVANDANQQL